MAIPVQPAGPDAYGLSDLSMLTGPQQDTARSIQQAFNNSQARYARDVARTPMLAPSAEMLSQNLEDTALARAGVTSNILNENQQLQNLIDASHATPHGVAQNLAAYLPLLGGVMRAYPALFGTNSAISQQGLLGVAASGVKKAVHYFTDPATGQTVGLDAQGNVIPPAQLGGNVDYGTPYGESAYLNSNWNPGAVDLSAAAPTATDVGAAVTTPYDFGQAVTPVSDTIPAVSDISNFFG